MRWADMGGCPSAMGILSGWDVRWCAEDIKPQANRGPRVVATGQVNPESGTDTDEGIRDERAAWPVAVCLPCLGGACLDVERRGEGVCQEGPREVAGARRGNNGIGRWSEWVPVRGTDELDIQVLHVKDGLAVGHHIGQQGEASLTGAASQAVTTQKGTGAGNVETARTGRMARRMDHVDGLTTPEVYDVTPGMGAIRDREVCRRICEFGETLGVECHRGGVDISGGEASLVPELQEAGLVAQEDVGSVEGNGGVGGVTLEVGIAPRMVDMPVRVQDKVDVFDTPAEFGEGGGNCLRGGIGGAGVDQGTAGALDEVARHEGILAIPDLKHRDTIGNPLGAGYPFGAFGRGIRGHGYLLGVILTMRRAS